MKRYYKDNQEPVLKEDLPFRIIFEDSDGNTVKRTKQSTFTDEEIIAAGYSIAPDKPILIPKNSYIVWDKVAEDWTLIQKHSKDHVIYKNNLQTKEVLLEEAKLIKVKRIENSLPFDDVDEYITKLSNMHCFNKVKVDWPQLDSANTA